MADYRMVRIQCPRCLGLRYFWGLPCDTCQSKGFVVVKIDEYHYILNGQG